MLKHAVTMVLSPSALLSTLPAELKLLDGLAIYPCAIAGYGRVL